MPRFVEVGFEPEPYEAPAETPEERTQGRAVADEAADLQPVDFEPEPYQGVELQAVDFEPEPYQYEEPGLGETLKEVGKGVVRGAVSELPRMTGETLEFLDQPGGSDVMRELGQDIQAFSDEVLERFPGLKEAPWVRRKKAEDPYSVRAGAAEAGEMAAPSMALPLAGAAAGSFFGPVGTAVGAGAGFIMSLPLFFGAAAKSTYDRVYEKKLEEGLDEETAHDIAWRAGAQSGAIEATGEAAADVITFRLMRFMPDQVKKDIVRAATKAIRSPRAMVKDLAKIAATEVGTELGQEAGQAEVLEAYGVGEGATWDDIKGVIVPTAILSIFTMGAAETVGGLRRRDLAKTLSDPSKPLRERAQAVQAVADELQKEDPVIANYWLKHSVAQMKEGKPITLAEDNFYRGAVQEPATEPATEEAVPEPEPGAAPVDEDVDTGQAEPAGDVVTDEELEALEAEEALREDAAREAAFETAEEEQAEVKAETEKLSWQELEQLKAEEAEKAAPSSPESFPANTAVDEQANEAATSPKSERPEPTEGQISAGNYKKGHVRLAGHDISVENPEGSTRREAAQSDVEEPGPIYNVSQTPEFREWFGESKITKRGKPRVMYHGDIFDAEVDAEPNPWTHFGTKEATLDRIGGAALERAAQNIEVEEVDGGFQWVDASDGYSDGEVYDTEEGARGAGERNAVRVEAEAEIDAEAAVLTDAYLRITNPLRMPDIHDWDDAHQVLANIPNEAIPPGRRPSILEEVTSNPDAAYEMIRDALEDAGYDGIVYRNRVEHRGNDSYIAFRPEQVKSASRNRGTFDRTDPNIVREPEVETKPEKVQTSKDEWDQKTQKTQVRGAAGRGRAASVLLRGRKRTLLGDAVSADFKAEGKSDLLGKEIRTPEDLATLAQVYRNPQYETLRYIFVRDGKVVGETGVTSRLPGSASAFVDRKNPRKEVEDLKSRMQKLGADSYYMLHNHPSGNPAPSRQDVESTKKFAKLIKGLKAHVVIDHNQYSVIEINRNYPDMPDVEVIDKEFDDTYDPDKHRVPHPLLGKVISDPSAVANIGRLAVNSPGYLVLIGHSRTGVRGLMEVSPDEMDFSRKGKLKASALIRRFARSTGSVDVFLANVPDTINWREAVMEAKHAGLIRDAVTDYGGSLALHVERDADYALGAPIKGLRVEEGRGSYRRRETAKTSTGKYIGAPSWVKTPQQLGQLRRRVRKLVEEGKPGRHWYENSGKAVLELVGGNAEEAKKIIQLIAIYSPQNRVRQNMSQALQAYFQWKSGVPREHFVVRPFGPQQASGLNTDKSAVALLYDGKNWKGRKTNAFYQNLMTEVDRQRGREPEHVVTVDMWVARAFGYENDGLPSNAASDTIRNKYSFAESELTDIAEETGWTPHQVQAALWTSVKARMEDAAVRAATNNKSIKKGWSEFHQKKDGKWELRRKGEHQAKHRLLWIETALNGEKLGEVTPPARPEQKTDPKPVTFNLNKAVNDAKYDFADALNAFHAQVSWESAPGKTSSWLPEYHDADRKTQQAFHKAMTDVIRGENGRDVIAERLGLMAAASFDAPGAFEGTVGPGSQTAMVAPPERGQHMSQGATATDPAAARLIDAYAAVLGYVFRQDAVAWHRPIYSTTLKASNGMEVGIGRQLTMSETYRLYNRVIERAGTQEFAPISYEGGVRFLNFSWTGVSNEEFHAIIMAAADDVFAASEATPDYRRFGTAEDRGYIENDWQESPDGQGYRQRIQEADGPGSFWDWVRDHLKPQVDQAAEAFAREQGWGSEARFSRKRRGGDERTREANARRNRESGLPVREDGTVRLTHWGPAGLESLDPSFHGTGIRGAEARRKTDNPDTYVDRVYFGLPGYRREPQLYAKAGRYTVYAHPGDFYDAVNDPDGLKDQARDASGRLDLTEYERIIYSAGYKGYFMLEPNAAAWFEPVAADEAVDEREAGERVTEAPFSRAPGAREGVDAADIEAAIRVDLDNLPGAVPVHVVDDYQGLPAAIRDRIESEGTDIEGVAWRGEVYLVASQIESVERARHVLFKHELQHIGLRKMLGKDLEKVLMSAWLGKESEAIKRFAKENGIKYGNRSGKLEAAEEYVVHMAETGQATTLLDRVLAMLKDFIRRVGFDLELSELDLRAMAAGAGKALKGEAKKPAGAVKMATKRAGENRELLEALWRDHPEVPKFSRKPRAVTDPSLQELLNLSNPQQKRFEWRGLIDRWGDRAKQHAVDRFHGLKAAEEYLNITDPHQSAYVAARLSTSTDTQNWVALSKGPLVWADNGTRATYKRNAKGLLTLLEGVADDFDLWKAWMVARRARRLLKAGKEKVVTQDMVDAADRAFKALPGEKKAAFEQAAADWADFNSTMLDFAEAAGVIDPDGRKVWESSDYIPFYRLYEDQIGAPRGRRGLSHQQGMKALTGGTAALNDVFENMMMNTAWLIEASMKNHALLMAEKNLAPAGLMTKAPMDFKPAMVPTREVKKALEDPSSPLSEIARAMEGQGIYPSAIDDAAWQGLQKMWQVQAPTAENVVMVRRNGKPEWYYVEDPILLRALTGVNQAAFGQWMELLRFPKRWLTTLVTAEPTFMLANYMRDTGQAFVVSRDHQRPILDSLRGLKGALEKSELNWDMLAAGGGFHAGYVTSHDPAATRMIAEKEMRKKGFKTSVLDTPRKLLDAWQEFGSAIENANRLGVAEAAVWAGKGELAAAFESKDFLDFTMRGDGTILQFLAETVPFLNARLQGLYRLGRGLRENPSAFLAKGMLITAASIALYTLHKDDERFKELEDWDRDLYWHFWTPSGRHVRLPKPFEVGVIFGTLPERLLESLVSESNDSGKLLLERIAWNAAEVFNLLSVPQAVAPVVEQVANRDFFTWRPIVGMAEEGRLPEAQYSQYTHDTAIAIGRVTGWSPSRIDHLMKSYTGTIGDYVLSGADVIIRGLGNYPLPPEMRVRDYPVIKRFVREGKDDPPYATRYRTEFYDLAREIEQTYRTIRYYHMHGEKERAMRLLEESRKDLRALPMARRVRKELQDINKRVRQIYTSRKVPPYEKRLRLDRLVRRKNQLYELAIKRASRLRER